MLHTMKAEKNMREALTDKLHLIFFIQILCFLAVPARGQQALDKTIQSNVELEKEIAALQKDSINIKNGIKNIRFLIGKDSLRNAELENKYNSLLSATSKDSISQLRQLVTLLEKQRDSLRASIASIKKDVAEKEIELKSANSELQNLDVFSEIKMQQIYKDNLLYLNKKYSQMTKAKLVDISTNQDKFQEFEGFSDYQKRIAAALKNKKVYDVAWDCINTGNEYQDVDKFRIDINALLEQKQDSPKKGIYKLTAEQFSELDSLDIKLSRFNSGIKALKDIVTKINDDENIKNIRGEKNADATYDCIERMRKYVIPQEGSEEAKIRDRYFKMIPYLDKLLRKYWYELKANPFVSTKTEEIIKNLVVK